MMETMTRADLMWTIVQALIVFAAIRFITGITMSVLVAMLTEWKKNSVWGKDPNLKGRR